jgi:F-type H+-transporting ATPase subunit g
MTTNSAPIAYRQPITYNLAVVKELAKQVYVAERLAPPTSVSAFTSAYSTLWSRATNPAYWREAARSGELTKVGVYAFEAYGIYKVCCCALSSSMIVVVCSYIINRLAR